MNSAKKVAEMIAGWQREGLTKAEIVVKTANACIGWPYVFGAAGAECNQTNRRSAYNGNINRQPEEAEKIKERCNILSGRKGSCAGCSYFPDSATRMFDCRGFTRWVLAQVGISLQGAGATSQWNTESNWTQKGEIRDMPENVVCCVFMQNKTDHKTMEHTGFCIGTKQIIHCSGTVKRGMATDRGWTHYAIPKGLGGDVPVWRTTIRRGSTGDDVKYCQGILIKLGYNLGSYGADGKFGAKTETAVKAFQKANGLNADGVVGPLTWDALEKAEPTEKHYKAVIHGLDKTQAEAMKAAYPNCEIIEE